MRASAGYLLRHPARWVALGFGCGLSPRAPATVATLWAWVAYLALAPWLDAADWAALIVVAWWLGVWACTRTARELGGDAPVIVWDTIVGFWMVLWLVMPAGLWAQLAVFVLYRLFAGARPQPVAWAHALFRGRPGQAVTTRDGFGRLFDDTVAAGCTVFAWALVASVYPVA